MREVKKKDPWQMPLEELKAAIDKCDYMLGKKLYPEVRATTEGSRKELDRIYQERISNPRLEVEIPSRLSGLGAQIEAEWQVKEQKGFVGELVFVYQEDKEFWVRANFGGTLEEMPESKIVRRITSKLIDIVKGKSFRSGLVDKIITSPGFSTLCEYVQALRFIKLEKAKIFDIGFNEISVDDVYKFSPPTKDKKRFLTIAIMRAVTEIPVESLIAEIKQYRVEKSRLKTQ